MLELESYETVKLTNHIELPDISELIRFPFCSQVDIDELYRYAPEDMKYILDRINLKNNTKYISINTCTQLLSPSTTSAPRANWHFDGNSFKEDNQTTIHLLVSKCDAVTEFASNIITLDGFDEDSHVGDAEVYLNKNLHLIQPIATEHSKFVTFDGCKHIHRAVRPSKHEFRFMMRVMESDVLEGVKYEESLYYQSDVFNDGVEDYSKIDVDYIMDNKTNSFPSIVKNDGRIKFYYND